LFKHLFLFNVFSIFFTFLAFFFLRKKKNEKILCFAGIYEKNAKKKKEKNIKNAKKLKENEMKKNVKMLKAKKKLNN